ncbi:hypothetical protein PoB_001898700 [Plakobranchus ocellatus]|uniref:Uncharacterized protein n=1 Tax=Plakobranchus ocellatus TaxID=259542 RepID=A0AAV3ZD93_9GAST|nr:hypothetical protein PoB_001898700 [Plakobranchus ocellatus]
MSVGKTHCQGKRQYMDKKLPIVSTNVKKKRQGRPKARSMDDIRKAAGPGWQRKHKIGGNGRHLQRAKSCSGWTSLQITKQPIFNNFINHDVCALNKTLMRMVLDNFHECVNTKSPSESGYYTCGEVAELKWCVLDYVSSHCDFATFWLLSQEMDRRIYRLFAGCVSFSGLLIFSVIKLLPETSYCLRRVYNYWPRSFGILVHGLDSVLCTAESCSVSQLC